MAAGNVEGHAVGACAVSDLASEYIAVRAKARVGDSENRTLYEPAWSPFYNERLHLEGAKGSAAGHAPEGDRLRTRARVCPSWDRLLRGYSAQTRKGRIGARDWR